MFKLISFLLLILVATASVCKEKDILSLQYTPYIGIEYQAYPHSRPFYNVSEENSYKGKAHQLNSFIGLRVNDFGLEAGTTIGSLKGHSKNHNPLIHWEKNKDWDEPGSFTPSGTEVHPYLKTDLKIGGFHLSPVFFVPISDKVELFGTAGPYFFSISGSTRFNNGIYSSEGKVNLRRTIMRVSSGMLWNIHKDVSLKANVGWINSSHFNKLELPEHLNKVGAYFKDATFVGIGACYSF